MLQSPLLICYQSLFLLPFFFFFTYIPLVLRNTEQLFSSFPEFIKGFKIPNIFLSVLRCICN